MAEFGFMDEVAVVEPEGSAEGHPDLPPVLQEIEGLIGFEGAMKLVRRWGGLNLYVPETIRAGHRIARTIGKEAADCLATYYGGDVIIMPRAHIYHSVRRQIEVYQRHKGGETAEALAAEYGVTWRAIYKMVSRETQRRARVKYQKLMRERGAGK